MQFLFERGSRFLTVKASYFVWIFALVLGGVCAGTAHAPKDVKGITVLSIIKHEQEEK